ncbi:Y+L amino acid transporter 2 [Folsomia candida]|uniref:Y+L amino acid transporter 2 n=1 Tax=Folsomia candida TaxID=158441 RepID=UPI000B908F9E|nr:Y+L amino acid transporter 2 [Folsomia candida]XP_035702775.1 Y+L amino acid transporter 2 [Folsomia candida]
MKGKRRGKGVISENVPELQVLNNLDVKKKDQSDTVELKKELGLIDGCAIILGVIIGAGIFVSPKGVLLYSGSPGLALIVWVLSGFLCLVGALCYAELGTMLPKSGGEYAYIFESFGELPAFLFMWVALIVIVPSGNAILSLTFSYYLLQPFWPDCQPPDLAVRLISAAVIGLLTAINCYNVKWGANLQTVFTATKIIALIVIIIAGLVVMCVGEVNNLADPFAVTRKDTGVEDQNGRLGNIALAFYSGLFSFAGWNYLNFVTEELKDPFRNLPRAIWISLPLVTLVYTLANVAYFVVLTTQEILDSNAVAVSFGDRILGPMAWIIPVFVACSTFGSLNGSIFAASRLVFVGAREGHLPKALALINIETFTPIPALVFLGFLSIAMLMIKDVYILINYVSFVEALAMGVTVCGLLWLRYKNPTAHRPIRMPIYLPIIFLIICIFLIFVPICTSPASEIGVAVIIVLSGIPVFLVFVYWKNKPKFLQQFAVHLDKTSALLFKGVQEESSKS